MFREIQQVISVKKDHRQKMFSQRQPTARVTALVVALHAAAHADHVRLTTNLKGGHF